MKSKPKKNIRLTKKELILLTKVKAVYSNISKAFIPDEKLINTYSHEFSYLEETQGNRK